MIYQHRLMSSQLEVPSLNSDKNNIWLILLTYESNFTVLSSFLMGVKKKKKGRKRNMLH